MGLRPSAPVIYRPTPTAPVIYQSVIPEEDFQLARDYVDELKAERAGLVKQREAAGLEQLTWQNEGSISASRKRCVQSFFT